ncbi:MAG TPA: ABC transporter permease [Bacteroidales bacterium]|jgi:ABC-2 type transport system permease protein|nr:ABC transporter permease [Bacteroidales bacterium]HQJ81994.1 ABC transporter permease [Bacteroidales bacterium]
MNKTAIIIKREYLTRVRKKSFIIMTILAPLLLAGFVILIPVIMLTGGKDHKQIAVIEEGTRIFRGIIPDTRDEKFVYLDNVSINDLITTFEQAGYFGILYISPQALNNPILYSKKQPDIGLLEHISGSLKKEIERQKLLTYNIQNLDSILTQIRTNVSVSTRLVDETGKTTETSTGISMALAYIGGLLMYMLVFVFGSQVMRGVIEEKTSRVVEVIVSSVKPAELMMGKIIGIALVGLTQFLIWIFLTTAAVSIVKSSILNKTGIRETAQSVTQDVMSAEKTASVPFPEQASVTPEITELAKIFDSAMNQNWLLIIFSFIFYFITGYLLYAAIFAAIGSAVDNETETQQFMLPVTIPILLALFVAMGTMQNPESSLAFWFSVIPLTSPIVMMARIPFGVPAWQLIVSMTLMLITFSAFVWMAAKVYRTGILMYGKKSSWKELWKWLRYTG